jgi:hypothetical protein
MVNRDELWISLEAAPIGWQLFILGSSQSDCTAFPLFLDTYVTRLLAQALSHPRRVGAWNGGLGRGLKAAPAAGVSYIHTVLKEALVFAQQLLTEVAL